MFDFDDLEEAEPADLGRVQSMPEGKFRGFRRRLETALEERRYEDIAAAYAEAVWDPELVSERMPKVVEVLKALLDRAAGQSPPDLESGAAIAYSLWQMSLSTSLYETRVRRSEAPGARSVLLLGFGGADVEDLEPQAAWYHGRGFTAISTSRALYPPVVAKRQDLLVAQALRDALSGGGGLVLHGCSQHGLCYGAHILWLWSRGREPFGNLPPLQECLKAVVFDCAAPPSFDPASHTYLYPTDRATTASMLPELQPRAVPSEPAPAAEPVAEVPLSGEDDHPSIKSETKFYARVLLGCMGTLCKKWGQGSVEEMIMRNKGVRKCIDAAARFTFFPQPWVGRLFDADTGSPSNPWAAFQLLDWGIEPAVPRLFLYSERDMLLTVDRVEAFIRHSKAYRPEAIVESAKLAKSAHCKNWEVEPEECAAAVSRLLELACIPEGTLGA